MPPAAATKPETRANRRRSLNLRERNLLAVGVWVFAILAAFACFQKGRNASAELATIRANIASQQADLDSKEDITTRLEAHAQRMEAARTVDNTELQSLMDSYARSIRLIPESNNPSTKVESGIQIISVNLVFRAATMDRLLLFEDKLRASHLPLIVTSTRLDSTRDGSVTAHYTVAIHRLASKVARPAPSSSSGKHANKPAPAPSSARNRSLG